MKKLIISTFSIAFLFGAMASAEVNIDEKALEQALEIASIKTDVKVWCGKNGRELTRQMATSLRQAYKSISNAQTNQKVISQVEKSASSYEGICEKSIKTAIQSGLSEAEVSQLLQE